MSRASLSFLSLIILLSFGCKHSTEPPLPPANEDTTSHDFTWQVSRIAGPNPSIVRDVAIVNDTCIWAVGDIFPPKPTGPYPLLTYGAAIWNGLTWIPMQVWYRDFGPTSEPIPGQLNAVWAFSSNCVYVCSAGNLLKWDGQNWTEKAFFISGWVWNGQVNKMWARNENDIYLVGRTGSIYHYTGNGWTTMASGTTVDLQDVWGDANKGVIWATGTTPDGFRSVLLEYENGIWKTVWARDGTTGVPPFDFGLGSVWTSSWTYVSSGGAYTSSIYRMKTDTTNLKLLASSSAFTNCLRGTGDYDILGAGEYGIIWHYNGSTYKELQEGNNAFRLLSCDIKGNLAVAVGTDHSTFMSQALFYVGRH